MKGTEAQVQQNILKLAREGYLYELRLLIKMVESNNFAELFPLLEHYKESLDNKNFVDAANLEQTITENTTINVGNCSAELKKVFEAANLTACCETFNGWSIPVSELKLNKAADYLQMALQNAGANIADLGRNMAVRLNKCDTARVINALKILGLLDINSTECRQLSICSSIGERDRHALHQLPFIAKAPLTIPQQLQKIEAPLSFGTNASTAEHIVMIDNDNSLTAVYEQLNKEEDNLLAMNIDLYEGLQKLSEKISNDEMKPRNLVVSFRLAPEAFSNVERFIDLLADVIDEEADFIVTIGAGDTLPEFKHRLEVMSEIYTGLSTRGMSPLRINYFKGNNAKSQQQGLLYGLSQYASYQTIYCRLNKTKLLKH